MFFFVWIRYFSCYRGFNSIKAKHCEMNHIKMLCVMGSISLQKKKRVNLIIVSAILSNSSFQAEFALKIIILINRLKDATQRLHILIPQLAETLFVETHDMKELN